MFKGGRFLWVNLLVVGFVFFLTVAEVFSAELRLGVLAKRGPAVARRGVAGGRGRGRGWLFYGCWSGAMVWGIGESKMSAREAPGPPRNLWGEK